MEILIIDDHAAIREEMVGLIQKEEDLHVVGQAAGGEDGVRMASQLHPDVILMDVMMPGMNGIAATKAVCACDPETCVLALSNHAGARLVEFVLQAGARGYVRKDRAYEDLVPAIRAVAKGEQYIGSCLDD